jgi:predicted site-specific integrase-resolvase
MKAGGSVGIMTAKEAADRWGITPRRVNEIIREGRIKGVYKIGTTWVMPDDTSKPPDLRSERQKHKPKDKRNE